MPKQIGDGMIVRTFQTDEAAN
jgi:hypothetical protein